MEDVLSVYTRPFDPKRPLICLDEKPLQLLGEVASPLPVAPGQPRKEDYEYQRNGTTNLFMLFDPLSGWRSVKVTDRRTKQDWAKLIRELVDVHYPQADQIVLMMDNLNTHSPASLYETFPPEEAHRLAQKLEIHFTPKHGSWLNMAEIELSLLSKQCLDRRLPDQDTLRREVKAWEERRNASHTKTIWRFTTADARVKLKKLYPSFLT
jgi:hypothetical protein